MISLLKKFTFLFVIFLAANCASVQTPSGGPSDKTPPQMKKSIPEPNTINFKGKEVILEFDEDVNADKLKSALVITPYKEDDFKVKAKKKTVKIIFQKEFKPNTTYTLNFREAIQDLTEKNSAKDLTLSFSTGSYIDSISFSGTVNDLMTNLPLENITVALYAPDDTSSLKSGKPIYFSKTDKSGAFNFKNLKNNIYNLYAFQDKNSNLHYDENEKIGFKKDFDLKSSKTNIIIPITNIDTKPPQISFIRPGNEKTDIKFNEGIILNKINFIDTNRTILYTITEDAKTISVFNNQNTFDSIPLTLNVSDSSGNTAEIKKNIIFEKKSSTKDPFTIKSDPADFKLDPGLNKIQLIFNKPIKVFNNNITIKANESLLQIADSNFSWNENKTRLSINKKIKSADSIVIETYKNTFISISGDSLNKQKLVFLIKKEEDYGILKGYIDTKQPDYILELVDQKFKILKSVKNIKAFKFNYLNPGTYYLRVIIDENKNGKWDNGNLQLNKEPEKIIYYKEKIQLRANWEIENIILKF
jgi:uncharacterized protein (DUF2141 family)